MSDLYANPRMAEGYARSRPQVHPLIIERVRAHLRLQTPLPRALDAGCGSGLSTRPLHTVARHSTGIDPAEPMLGWASSVAPDADFLVARAERLPFRARSFHLITAAGSLNYADQRLFFEEARRVLIPGGAVVVYDFSAGRSFPDSPALDAWFAGFHRRYPPPPAEARFISPETLRDGGFALSLSAHEIFEIPLVLHPDFYLDYMMTETNVSHAVGRGIPAGEIRSWCQQTLAPVFGPSPREVLFRGYIAYMR
ncbi:MAG: class I SAM-dependent methyltransferase [Bryobacterales bacterium]|nr:class I SAM-dependent methyltransferase [Bryobacterales bacterium]